MSNKRNKHRDAHNKKHTKHKKSKKQQSIHLINLILTILLVTSTISIASYFVFFNNWNEKDNIIKTAEEKIIEQMSEFEEELPDDAHKYFEEKTEAFDKIYLTQKPENIEKPNTDTTTRDEDKDKKDPLSLEDLEKENKAVKKEEKTPKKPMLALVIDDVSWKAQVDLFQKIGIDLTMSFLPPTPRHKNSAKIARVLDTYMIHLPLQATSFKYEEENTLHIGDSLEKIDKRIAIIKKQYPTTKYINNHTGSKFTADAKSMDRLMSVMKKYGYYFLDSKTTAKSVAKEYAKKHGVKFVTRNIFLDNEKDFSYIQGQLKKALKLAKKRGYAIAIGHPYKITAKVLRESKELFKDFELVTIDKIPFH